MLQREWSRIHASIKSSAQSLRRRYYACKILREELRREEPLMWRERICQWRRFGSVKSQRMARWINESIESVFEKMIIVVVIHHLHNSELHLLWPMMCVWSCCWCSIIIDNKPSVAQAHAQSNWMTMPTTVMIPTTILKGADSCHPSQWYCESCKWNRIHRCCKKYRRTIWPPDLYSWQQWKRSCLCDLYWDWGRLYHPCQ